MKIRSVKFILMAQDMERAVGFWRDGVGLDVRMTSPWWSELTWGDATVALHGGGDGKPRKTGLGMQVEDIEAACREVEAAGGRVLSGPVDRPEEGIRIADLVDPEGNGFGLSQLLG